MGVLGLFLKLFALHFLPNAPTNSAAYFARLELFPYGKSLKEPQHFLRDLERNSYGFFIHAIFQHDIRPTVKRVYRHRKLKRADARALRRHALRAFARIACAQPHPGGGWNLF